jgi:TctA family transporter
MPGVQEAECMDPVPIMIVVLVAIIGGLLGSSCALVPGFHSNALALVLLVLLGPLSYALSCLASFFCCDISGTMLFAALLVAAATSHSFVDFVPSIFLGVPDEDTVLSMLPAHRLLKSGKGMDAIRYAALGSLSGALMAILLAVPLLLLLRPPSLIGEVLDSSVPYLLAMVFVLLALTERGHEEPRAHLDARRGGCLPNQQITICHPIPVDGADGTISGRITFRGLRSFRLSTPWGDWRIVSRMDKPKENFVTVQGTWVVTRGSGRSKLVALAILSLSGLLGFAVMNSHPPFTGTFDGLGQSLLFPLLSGLFAFPSLLSATSSKQIPAQDEAKGEDPTIGPALTGTFAGFLAGWMPGITSTIGTVIGSCFSTRPKDQEKGAKTYILMLSAVGTSSVVFSLLALCVEGSGRTGAMLALKQALGQGDLGALSSFPSASASLLLIAALVASAIGYRYTLWAGRVLSKRTAGRDLGGINRFVLLGLLGLILAFNGLPGLVVVAVAALVGSLPPRLGVRRVHLTGCLLVPLILFYLGLESTAIGLLW